MTGVKPQPFSLLNPHNFKLLSSFCFNQLLSFSINFSIFSLRVIIFTKTKMGYKMAFILFFRWYAYFANFITKNKDN